MNDLQVALDEYLDLRRSLGFKLRDESTVLPQFLGFLQEERATVITIELALRWATQPEGVLPTHWARRLSMVRLFARFRSGVDARTEVPPQGLLPFRYHRRPPHIYHDEEVSILVEAAGRLKSQSGLRRFTYSTLFGLIAITGMRIAEPIALDRDDVDLTRGILTIRRTKFGKSRFIPVHSSTVQALENYSRTRDQVFPRPKSSSFFVSDKGVRLTQCNTRYIFVKLSREIGLRGPNDSHGPRLHDLRHTFAVKTLLRWYRTGANVEHRLPELATYLGHTHVNDTYWYLSAIPELLQLAVARLDTAKGDELS
jgi:integrase